MANSNSWNMANISRSIKENARAIDAASASAEVGDTQAIALRDAIAGLNLDQKSEDLSVSSPAKKVRSRSREI